MQGDSVADTILKHGVGELFRSVKAVVTRLDLDRQGQGFQLVLAGAWLVPVDAPCYSRHAYL
jgi:hypothetical protein